MTMCDSLFNLTVAIRRTDPLRDVRRRMSARSPIIPAGAIDGQIGALSRPDPQLYARTAAVYIRLKDPEADYGLL